MKNSTHSYLRVECSLNEKNLTFAAAKEQMCRHSLLNSFWWHDKQVFDKANFWRRKIFQLLWGAFLDRHNVMPVSWSYPRHVGSFFLYGQAFHIDWAVLKYCPINVKIYGTFLGQFQNCPINVEDYPINVKCLPIPYRQAFHIDWAVFKSGK